MPSYLILGNWTDKGIREIKESPDRLEAARKAAEAAGGKIVFFYMTMGQYDLAVLTELPDDEAAEFFFILRVYHNGMLMAYRAYQSGFLNDEDWDELAQAFGAELDCPWGSKMDGRPEAFRRILRRDQSSVYR